MLTRTPPSPDATAIHARGRQNARWALSPLATGTYLGLILAVAAKTGPVYADLLTWAAEKNAGAAAETVGVLAVFELTVMALSWQLRGELKDAPEDADSVAGHLNWCVNLIRGIPHLATVAAGAAFWWAVIDRNDPAGSLMAAFVASLIATVSALGADMPPKVQEVLSAARDRELEARIRPALSRWPPRSVRSHDYAWALVGLPLVGTVASVLVAAALDRRAVAAAHWELWGLLLVAQLLWYAALLGWSRCWQAIRVKEPRAAWWLFGPMLLFFALLLVDAMISLIGGDGSRTARLIYAFWFGSATLALVLSLRPARQQRTELAGPCLIGAELARRALRRQLGQVNSRVEARDAAEAAASRAARSRAS